MMLDTINMRFTQSILKQLQKMFTQDKIWR